MDGQGLIDIFLLHVENFLDNKFMNLNNWMISLGDREVKVRKRRENRIDKDMTQIITTFFFNSSLKY